MHRFQRNLVFLLLIIPVFFITVTVSAQSRFGIDWQQTGPGTANIKQLEQLKNEGFSSIIIHGKLNRPVLQFLQQNSFRIYVQFPYSYLTDNQITGDLASILNKDLALIDYYDSLRAVKGYILFREGQLKDHDFKDWLQVINGDLAKHTNKSLLFISSYRLTSLPNGSTSYLYRTDLTNGNLLDSTLARNLLYLDPAAVKRFSLRKLNDLLTHNQETINIPVFFPYEWYSSVAGRQPAIKDMIRIYASDAHAVFPTPPSPENPPPINWIVLLLIIGWVIFAVHFNFEPNYRKSVIRYFGYHSFFIADISERLDRMTVSNLIVLGLISLSGGIMFYALSLYFFTDNGLQALSSHIPILHLFGHSWIIFFFIGTLVTLLYNLLCYLLLTLLSLNINNVSQILTIYLWPQQIILLVVSTMVPVILSGAPKVFVIILTLIFFLVITTSFYMAATDCDRLAKYPALFKYGSMSIHAIGVIVIISWIITFSGLPDLINMASSLP